MSNFHVGQKVVCVDDTPHPYGPQSVSVRKGCVYTVAGFGIPTNDGCPSIFVVEVRAANEGEGYGFLAYRFRPVAERKTDISCFTAMLEPKKARVDA
jgi:hypothetical protein